MGAKALEDYHEAVRLLVGDGGDGTVGYDYTTDQVNGALRTVVRLGFVSCVELSEDGLSLTEEPAHADTGAFLAAKAAHILMGGEKAQSLRTRALTVTTLPASYRERIHYIESLLEEIETRGNVCATSAAGNADSGFASDQDFITRACMPYCACECEECCTLE
jgi:hypothetical protein